MEQNNEQQLRDEISKLKDKISELSIERDKIKDELYSTKNLLYSCEKEKEKLFSIIENLSKGIAKLGEKT